MLKARGMELLNGARLSLELASGVVHTLTGPNGAGKSLLLKSLALLHPAAWEEYRFQGEDVATLSPQLLRRRLLYVPSAPLETSGSVEDYLMAPWRLKVYAGESPLSPYRAELGRAGFLEREFSLLSSGEKQWVQLYRALSLGPRALLLDEPTGHMDPLRTRAAEELLLAHVKAHGTTVLWVGHDGAQGERLGSVELSFSTLLEKGA